MIVPRRYRRAKLYDCLKGISLIEAMILVLTGIVYWMAGIEAADAPRILQVMGLITILLAFLSGFGWQTRGVCSEERVALPGTLSDSGIHGRLRQDFYSGSVMVLGLGFLIGVLNILFGALILRLM